MKIKVQDAMGGKGGLYWILDTENETYTGYRPGCAPTNYSNIEENEGPHLLWLMLSERPGQTDIIEEPKD